MNGPLKFLTARKILPLFAKFIRVLACSCSPNFCIARKLAKRIFYFCSCSQKDRKYSQRPFVTPDCRCQYYYPVYLSFIIFVTILLSFVVVLCGPCFILFGGGRGRGGGGVVAHKFGVFVRTVLWPLAPYFFSQVTRKS